MSDALDPRHGPYRGNRAPAPVLEEWAHELLLTLMKRGAVSGDTSVKKVSDDIKQFAEQVVRATRDGHFSEVT